VIRLRVVTNEKKMDELNDINWTSACPEGLIV
jgi:hypothetical protein